MTKGSPHPWTRWEVLNWITQTKASQSWCEGIYFRPGTLCHPQRTPKNQHFRRGNQPLRVPLRIHLIRPLFQDEDPRRSGAWLNHSQSLWASTAAIVAHRQPLSIIVHHHYWQPLTIVFCWWLALAGKRGNLSLITNHSQTTTVQAIIIKLSHH